MSYRKLNMIITSRYSRRKNNLVSGFIFQKFIYKDEIDEKRIIIQEQILKHINQTKIHLLSCALSSFMKLYCGKGTSKAKRTHLLKRIPWQFSGWDSGLPLQGVWVQTLVRELRSLVLPGLTKSKKIKIVSVVYEHQTELQ